MVSNCVFIDDQTYADIAFHQIGKKASEIGRFGGEWVLQEGYGGTLSADPP
jgi:hypothetical protein